MGSSAGRVSQNSSEYIFRQQGPSDKSSAMFSLAVSMRHDQIIQDVNADKGKLSLLGEVFENLQKNKPDMVSNFAKKCMNDLDVSIFNCEKYELKNMYDFDKGGVVDMASIGDDSLVETLNKNAWSVFFASLMRCYVETPEKWTEFKQKLDPETHDFVSTLEVVSGPYIKREHTEFAKTLFYEEGGIALYTAECEKIGKQMLTEINTIMPGQEFDLNKELQIMCWLIRLEIMLEKINQANSVLYESCQRFRDFYMKNELAKSMAELEKIKVELNLWGIESNKDQLLSNVQYSNGNPRTVGNSRFNFPKNTFKSFLGQPYKVAEIQTNYSIFTEKLVKRGEKYVVEASAKQGDWMPAFEYYNYFNLNMLKLLFECKKNNNPENLNHCRNYLQSLQAEKFFKDSPISKLPDFKNFLKKGNLESLKKLYDSILGIFLIQVHELKKGRDENRNCTALDNVKTENVDSYIDKDNQYLLDLEEDVLNEKLQEIKFKLINQTVIIKI